MSWWCMTCGERGVPAPPVVHNCMGNSKTSEPQLLNVEERTLEEIEEDYDDVELTNDGLAGYSSDGAADGLYVYSVVSRWMGGHKVPHDDVALHEAVAELDRHFEWAKANVDKHPNEIDLDEILAYRALLASDWNEQFKEGVPAREDGLGPIERRD